MRPILVVGSLDAGSRVTSKGKTLTQENLGQLVPRWQQERNQEVRLGDRAKARWLG